MYSPSLRGISTSTPITRGAPHENVRASEALGLSFCARRPRRYSFVFTLIILKVVDATVRLRLTEDDEITGLDLSQHGEVGYNL
jgi:Amt family ammonium transporter